MLVKFPPLKSVDKKVQIIGACDPSRGQSNIYKYEQNLRSTDRTTGNCKTYCSHIVMFKVNADNCWQKRFNLVRLFPQQFAGTYYIPTYWKLEPFRSPLQRKK